MPVEVLRGFTQEDKTKAIDVAKATYIANTMATARREWRQHYRLGSQSASEARRRSILSRMNHNQRLTAGSDGTEGSVAVQHTLSPMKGSAATASTRNAESGSQSVAGRYLTVTDQEREICMKNRCPKAIVFSQHHWDLQVSNFVVGTLTFDLICIGWLLDCSCRVWGTS